LQFLQPPRLLSPIAMAGISFQFYQSYSQPITFHMGSVSYWGSPTAPQMGIAPHECGKFLQQ
jgi:hypothetical protein